MQDSLDSTSSPTYWRYGFFNLFLLIILGNWFWQQNLSVTPATPDLSASEKLQCVSYSPYYGEDQTPYHPDTRISPAQIDHDLQLLSQRFACVRIYSVSQGLDYVPVAASKLGLKVLLGAWIGWVSKDNDKELGRAIALANQYPDVVKGLIVGNEVLLRGEQTEAAMQTYLERARQASKVPVTYADVWEFWLKHKGLEKSVDFVTVHILPYWEDDPQPIDHAIGHIRMVMDKLAANFSKPLLIGETGWPSTGRQRGESIPSQINQARYLREFVQLAKTTGWNYNLIEAIDQPWKRQSEGTVGGYWGLYTTQLQPKFDFSGPVAERHDGWRTLCWPLLGALFWGGLALIRGRKHSSVLFAQVAMGALIGTWSLLVLEYLLAVCRNKIEWLALGGLALFGLLALVIISGAVLGRNNRSGTRVVLNLVMLVLLAGTLIASWLLWTDGRYRDFPIVIYALPTLQLSIGSWLAGINLRQSWRPYYLLNLAAIGLASACAWLEPDNLHALLWLGLTVLLTFASWPGHKTLSTGKA